MMISKQTILSPLIFFMTLLIVAQIIMPYSINAETIDKTANQPKESDTYKEPMDPKNDKDELVTSTPSSIVSEESLDEIVNESEQVEKETVSRSIEKESKLDNQTEDQSVNRQEATESYSEREPATGENKEAIDQENGSTEEEVGVEQEPTDVEVDNTAAEKVAEGQKEDNQFIGIDDPGEEEKNNLKVTEEFEEEATNLDNETIEVDDEIEEIEKPVSQMAKQQSVSTLSTTSLAKASDPWSGAKADYFKVTTDNLTVYDNRGDGPLKPVGKLKKDQVYSIVSDYGNWWRVQFGDIYGYVRKSDTIPGSKSEINNENKSHKNSAHKYKANKNVTVYDNTSGSLVAFGEINKNQLFTIATDYGNWWRLIFLDRVGYVRKSEGELQHASFNNYFKADRDTAIYDNRGSGPLKKVGEVTEGQAYEIVNDYGNWHRIQFGDIYGYVKKFDTTPDNGSSIKNKNTSYKQSSRDFQTLQNVTVYDNASGKLVPFGKLDENTVFPIAADYGNWWRIILNDRVGYVRKAEVQAEFQKGDKYFRVHKNDLPIYDNRQTGPLKKVGSLQKNEVFEIVSDYGNWWRVQFSDFYGYVKKSDTGYATGNEIENENTRYLNSSKRIIPLKNTIVYDNTSGSLVKMGTIDKNGVYHIATDNGTWWRIVYLDRVGYIRKTDVKNYEFIQGDRHDDIPSLKKKLNHVGFSGISETAYYGDFTENRVKQFQKYYGLSVNGSLNENTIKKLDEVYNSPFQLGKRHKETIQLKEKLNQLGYGKISVTTLYGSFTEQQVKKFQKDHGLKVNGIADSVTLKELNKAIQNQNVVKIFLDPGHGGHDPGASGYGLQEKNVVLDIALKVADVLTSKYLGVEVNLSRTTDKFIELADRAKMANDWGADYFVSIHNNAFNGSANGFESFIYNGNVSNETKDRQQDIHNYLASRISSNDRGQKSANFHVLRETNMPSILIEYLFIDNFAENALLKTKSFRNKLGEMTADAIASSFGLKRK